MSGSDCSLVSKFVLGGTSGMVASAILNPFALIKVRLQVCNDGSLSARRIVRDLIREEGYRGFLKGITPAMLREASYSSIRIGAYDPIKHIINPSGSDNVLMSRILAGALSGSIGAAIANPTDLVLTRMQASKTAPYRSTWHAFRHIYKHEGGVKGLYRGVGSTVARAAVLTSCQLATYETVKRALIDRNIGFGDDVSTYFTAAMLSGLVTTTIHIPIDVIKSRMQNTASGSGGVLHYIRQTIKNEGAMAPFVKGWLPAYLRIGPHTVISLVLTDQLRQWLGIKTI